MLARYLLTISVNANKIIVMKQILSMVVAVFLFSGTACACMKKSRQLSEISLQPLTVIVTDTTQALLNGVEVKAGKAVFKTSWDGRVVLQPEQLRGVKKLSLSCKGYKELKIKNYELKINEGNVLLVSMTPKPSKEHGAKGGKVFRTSGLRSEKTAMYEPKILYRTEDIMADGVAMESDRPMMAVAAEEAVEETIPVGYAGTANNVSAGKLTAGEVNDFAKWHFWPTVIDNTHKQFVQEWQIAPRHRYTVQVVNQNGYPIAARAVSLLDNSGNTLFQAVTDNTGKAELWYQLTGNNLCGKHTDFYVRVDDQKQVAKQWAEGGNTFVLDEPCQNDQMANDQMVNDVDVVFVFDATGSMGDELRYLQAEMKDVIARATESTGGLKIRTGAVVYRDHGDEYLTRISRLTDDIKTTQSFIDNQHAGGGGDFPEAVPEALMAALNSAGWNSEARARIAFLVLDAPCHQDSVTLALLHEQVLNAAALGVRIVPVVCSGLRESGEYLLRSIALATNGTSFFLTDDSGIGHPHLKPTTDSLKVEHLNDMLVRTIVEFSYMPDCTGHWHEEEINQIEDAFVPNPYSAQDLESDPSIPHGPTTLYLMDVSGKLITVYTGEMEHAGDSQLAGLGLRLPTGVYFIKAFYEGEWHTKKILVH